MANSLYNILSDSSRKTADAAVRLIEQKPELFGDFLDFSLRDEPQYAMRAARVLALITEKNPSFASSYIIKIMKSLPDISNDGLKRDFIKILGLYKIDMDDDNLGILVDFCFKWLNASEEKIAIKVYSMDLLFQVCKHYPDMQNELRASIEDQMEKGSGAIRSRGNEILRQMAKL